MKIIKAKAWKEAIKLTRPYTIAYQVIAAVEIIYITLETDSGIIGFGSATPAEFVTGEGYAECLNALDKNLEELTIGKDIRHIHSILRECQSTLYDTPAACATIDLALHDLFGKYLDIPLVKFFGQVHHSLPTSITIGIKPVDESIAEAIEYKGRGFKIIKLKVGKELDEDIEMTRKIFETVGGQMLIRVDANQGYSAKEFKKYVRTTKSLGLEFVEQPLPVEQTGEMKKLPLDLRQYAAGDESIHKPFDALKWANAPKAFGIYNIKLMKCGGISAGKQIANIANLAGIRLMWGCMDESCLSIAAALHAAFSSTATQYIDLDGSFDLASDLFTEGFILENGVMQLTDNPGLGVKPV